MNLFQNIFDAQKALFATGVTRTYEWRVEQLDRMAGMIRENELRLQEAMAKDFKTASQEYIFETQASAGETQVQKSQLKEWMKPVEAPIPRFLAETGHKGMIYREPYGVALIIGPFNGPLLLLIRPALAALAAGNTCILTLSEALRATNNVLLELVPKYFDPSAVTAVPGGKEQNTELLKLPFDFIFFTGSTSFARIAATPRPLAGFVFSRDQKTIDRFIGELSYGGGEVNLVNVYLFVETMPFGGTGSAGMGHYYGKYGFDALTHAKSMLISPPDVAIEHLYSPFTDEKNRALQGWFEY